MPRLKTRLVEQRWHFLLLALLLQRASTLGRARVASHDRPGTGTELPASEFLPTSEFLVISADRAPAAPAVEQTDTRTLTTPRVREMTSSTTPERGAEVSIADRARAGLLALALAVSAGIHIGLAPEHLEEMPRLGVSFIVAAVLGSAIAVALVARPGDRRIAALAGLFCLAEILAWVLFVTVRVPLFPGTPEPVETIALVSKAVEAVGWFLALWIVGPGEAPSRKALLGRPPTADGS